MKKIGIFVVLVVVLAIVGCSSSAPEKSSLAMSDFVSAFEKEGVEVDKDEKPMFEMIGAKDGVLFYVDGSKVAIYEYESEKALDDQRSKNSLIKEWKNNGKFLLEAKNEKAIDIFTNLKK